MYKTVQCLSRFLVFEGELREFLAIEPPGSTKNSSPKLLYETAQQGRIIVDDLTANTVGIDDHCSKKPQDLRSGGFAGAYLPCNSNNHRLKETTKRQL